MADDWEPPGEFEEYRLLRLLGRGGMGSVWLAEDRLLDRMVAIKWIAREAPSARMRQRFAREARAAARLQHVNVVSVYRYGETAGRAYLVSEYVRGQSLDRLVKPVPWERALELGISLARGLAAAHRQGIVHRDIKPANAILSEDGEVKLVDFGLAYIEQDASASSSWATAPAPRASGTPVYIAPEVRRGEVATRRSDVYQVGGILFELVTSTPPILDLGHETVTADLDCDGERHEALPGGTDDALAIPRLADRVAPEAAGFAAVVDRCLSVDPRDRFASGDELRDALEQVRGAPVASVEVEGNPYRGLLPFESEHRAVFFGRAAEARALAERLRGDAFVLVAGDSGVGKSSLCRAAVLPLVADSGLDGASAPAIVRLAPGVRPMSTLVAMLSAQLALPEGDLEGLRDQPVALVRELRRAAPDGLVVFVDQLEELVSQAEAAEAEAAAAVLAELAVGIPGVRLLATVRSDFLSRVAELPALGSEVARAIHLLGPLTAEGTREAVTGPARATGVRFESEALVDELVSFVADRARTRPVAALPLLSFTLAELWEARDRSTSMISAASLAAIGGVRGALASHADGVIERLLPDQNQAARRILVRLIGPGNTRARRSGHELGVDDRASVAALDALVRGRLVVARGAGEGATYELAHEGLIDGWPALASLVSETEHTRAVHDRLAAAVADWQRLQRADGLWSARQLVDVEVIRADELTADETAFVRASRRTVSRRRWLRRAAAALVPVAAFSLYVGAKSMSARDLDTRIARELIEADGLRGAAQTVTAEHARVRDRAFAAFDSGELGRAEEEWAAAVRLGDEAVSAYARTARVLEAAFLLDTNRETVRRRLAEVTFERLRLADEAHRHAERDELAARLALYDPRGELASRLAAPAVLDLAIEPSDTTVTLLGDGTTAARPLAPQASLSPGAYVLELRAVGRTAARLPVRVGPGDRRQIAFTLPLAEHVPPGFVFVPPGTFSYGSRDAETIRRFFATAPLHDVETGGYLIGVHEVTYADWIAYLEELPASERAQRTPSISGSATVQLGGTLSLGRGADGVWELVFGPADIVYRARAGEPIVYPERGTRAAQDWRRFPVSGITPEDAVAYAAWLARTGRVPRARLCDEREWERAARGVDGRSYPHGEALAPDDANFDLTYGQRPGGFGPDEVGAHPASHSVHGLADTAGNVWDLARTAAGDGFVIRGGCFYLNSYTAHLANRQEIPASFRHLQIGFRVCADLPP